MIRIASTLSGRRRIVCSHHGPALEQWPSPKACQDEDAKHRNNIARKEALRAKEDARLREMRFVRVDNRDAEVRPLLLSCGAIATELNASPGISTLRLPGTDNCSLAGPRGPQPLPPMSSIVIEDATPGVR